MNLTQERAMRLRLLSVTMFILIWCFPASGQAASCLDRFRDFQILEPEINPLALNQDYPPVMAWYGTCIVVGGSEGLWLIDPIAPDNALQIARTADSTVSHVAVNPEDWTIAFSVPEEPTVYFVNPDKTMPSISADGQAVTDISFSPSGSLLAVASSDIDDIGIYIDARVQIWNQNRESVAMLSSSALVVADVFITADEQNVVTHGVNSGYVAHVVEYWDLETGSRIWDYNDLLRGLAKWSANDPLAVFTVSAQNHTLALGGWDGYYDYDEYYGSAVHIWDADSQRRVREIIIHRRGLDSDDSYLTTLALNSDGSILATLQKNGVLSLWNDFKVVETALGVDKIHQLMFSPDDKWLGILSDETFIVLDGKSLNEVASFELPDISH